MFRWHAWLFSIALVAALPAHGQTLSLPEAQRLAVARSPQLAAQDRAISASRDMAVAAGQLPDPVLKLGIDNLPVDGPDRFNLSRDFMTMRRVGVAQELTRGAKRELRSQRFEREAEKSTAEKGALLADIQRDTALAWLDRYYAERMASLLADQLTQARLEVQAAEAAYRGGRAGQPEVIAAHGTVAMIEDRASELASRVRVAKSNLARWAGEAADAPLAAPPAMDDVGLDTGSLEQRLAVHPQIVALAKQAEAAVAEARLAEASRTPDWTVEMAYQQRGGFSDMVSFGISVPLPWDRAHRQDREAAAKRAFAEQARAQREEALRAHIGEVRAMLVEWRNDRERLARYERDIVPLAGERARAALAGYQGGRTSISDLLMARRSEAEARLQAAQLEADAAKLWARLTYLIPHTEAKR